MFSYDTHKSDNLYPNTASRIKTTAELFDEITQKARYNHYKYGVQRPMKESLNNIYGIPKISKHALLHVGRQPSYSSQLEIYKHLFKMGEDIWY